MILKNHSLFVIFLMLFCTLKVQAEEHQVKILSNQVYAQQGETQLKADIYQPLGNGPFPGVIMVHGGAWAGGSRSHMALHAKKLASSGYCVACIFLSFGTSPQISGPID